MIESINIKNLFSFGPNGTPELQGLKQFNLFIGKNGSGKSNVFRALTLKESEYGENKFYSEYRINPKTKEKSYSYVFKESAEIIVNEKNWLEIKDKFPVNLLGDGKILLAQEIDDISVKMKKNNAKVWDLFDKCIQYIFPNFSFVVFRNENFPLRYFANKIKNNNGKALSVNYENSFSGLSAVVSLFYSIPEVKSDILFIEEIENRLEPMSIRRLVEVLYVLTLEETERKNLKNNDFIRFLEEKNTKEGFCWNTEIQLIKVRQVFFTSHSSVLINEFIKMGKNAKIFEFNLEKKEGIEIKNINNDYINGAGRFEGSFYQTKINLKSSNNLTSILDNLGCKGSDLLQANGIIWVEGPSDRIYINYWLQKIFPNSNFVEGQHYSIMFYGGKLLSHLTGNQYEYDEGLVEEFIQLPKINQKMAIIIDSDKNSENAEIRETKIRIKNEFEKNHAFVWVTSGREIENYLDPIEAKNLAQEMKNQKAENFGIYDNWIGKDKPKFAKKVQEKEIRINPVLEKKFMEQIQILHKTIQSWNL
jgi:predicted ATP-dependent endonuclease of OLD family